MRKQGDRMGIRKGLPALPSYLGFNFPSFLAYTTHDNCDLDECLRKCVKGLVHRVVLLEGGGIFDRQSLVQGP